jgi:hypothetical protein
MGSCVNNWIIKGYHGTVHSLLILLQEEVDSIFKNKVHGVIEEIILFQA